MADQTVKKIPKSRKPRFTEEAANILVDFVLPHLETLIGEKSRRVSANKKEGIWNRIANEVNAVLSVKRTGEDCKKKWYDIRKSVRRKYMQSRRESKVAGGGGEPVEVELSPVEQRVAETMDPTSLQGVGGIDSGYQEIHMHDSTGEVTDGQYREDDTCQQYATEEHPMKGQSFVEKTDEMQDNMIVVKVEPISKSILTTAEVPNFDSVYHPPKSNISLPPENLHVDCDTVEDLGQKMYKMEQECSSYNGGDCCFHPAGSGPAQSSSTNSSATEQIVQIQKDLLLSTIAQNKHVASIATSSKLSVRAIRSLSSLRHGDALQHAHDFHTLTEAILQSNRLQADMLKQLTILTTVLSQRLPTIVQNSDSCAPANNVGPPTADEPDSKAASFTKAPLLPGSVSGRPLELNMGSTASTNVRSKGRTTRQGGMSAPVSLKKAKNVLSKTS